jgi:hypothetical protein
MSELKDILWDWELFLKRWNEQRTSKFARFDLERALLENGLTGNWYWTTGHDLETTVDWLMTVYPTSPDMWEIVKVLDPQLKKMVELDSR